MLWRHRYILRHPVNIVRPPTSAPTFLPDRQHWQQASLALLLLATLPYPRHALRESSLVLDAVGSHLSLHRVSPCRPTATLAFSSNLRASRAIAAPYHIRTLPIRQRPDARPRSRRQRVVDLKRQHNTVQSLNLSEGRMRCFGDGYVN